jgi:hypothetical protein
MPAKSKTAHFTKRGNHFGNLWSVYSLKINQPMRLGSDRLLAHWLLRLEFSSAVISFRFGPSAESTFSDVPDGIEYHFKVEPADGAIELHYLRTEGHSLDYADKIKYAARFNYKYIEFNDEDLIPAKEKILPLLKLASFLNGGRHVYIPPHLRDAAENYISNNRRGVLGSFVSSLSNFDSNLCLLMFCRMYSERTIDVDFESNFFSRSTMWWKHE